MIWQVERADLAILVSIAAAVIALAAAAFAGWTAWNEHRGRKDARSIALSLRHQLSRFQEDEWYLDNAGRASALNPRVTVTFHFKDHPPRSGFGYANHVIGPDGGSARLSFDGSKPWPDPKVRTTENEELWAAAEVVAEYGVAWSKRRITRHLPIPR